MMGSLVPQVCSNGVATNSVASSIRAVASEASVTGNDARETTGTVGSCTEELTVG